MKPNSISEAQDVKAETLQKDYLESEIKTTTTKTDDDAKKKMIRNNCVPGNREEPQEGSATASRHHQHQRPLQLMSSGDSQLPLPS